MVYYGSFSSEQVDPLKGDRRHVFLLEAGLAIVVKFVKDVGFTTVKIWDVKKASIERTLSYWRTRLRYDAIVGKIMSAYSFASDAVDRSHAQISASSYGL